MKKAMLGFAHSWVSLSSAIVPLVKNAGKGRAAQARILKAIGYMAGHIGMARALKMVGLSKNLYYQWLLEARFDCFDSFTSLCMKRHPHQLKIDEIKKIKKLLLDPEYGHWPICSIAALALP